MKRSYYDDQFSEFKKLEVNHILGELSLNHSFDLNDLQKNAWVSQIQLLQEAIDDNIRGKIYFEFGIPRMGKRVDNILIINGIILVVEFKIGEKSYPKHAVEQVLDYSIDLQNFHEGSHSALLIPVLVCTKGYEESFSLEFIKNISNVVKLNAENLGPFIKYIDGLDVSSCLNVGAWENSSYKPTPTIVQAAQALYKGHNVDEISRSDSGAINLSKTANCLSSIIESSKQSRQKSICFVTGVPGAGKTLAGLNIATSRMKVDEDEHAVFLSGNGPLVDVLREALTRDEVRTGKSSGVIITKKEAAIKSNAFIQNIHHFRDDNLRSIKPPVEKVVVFDEAQRAWTKKQASDFMSRKKGVSDFDMSEPEFLISVMDRHSDWCTIVCLIGGGQEINTGEAGLEEWVASLGNSYTDWKVYFSEQIVQDQNYLRTTESISWLKYNGNRETNLHLAVSVRSFRSERVSEFVQSLLDVNLLRCQQTYESIHKEFPIVVTRSLKKAKQWLRFRRRGTERIGIVSSSGAKRLRTVSVDVAHSIVPSNWFLNTSSDIRSSDFLEEVATEFDIQGLEIDWTCLAWGANLFLDENNEWNFRKLSGTKWQKIKKDVDQQYLLNSYRVLLTRARQGMIIFIPEGDSRDQTRDIRFYDGTFAFLKAIGLQEI
ncbi:DUF2075 domain-containing protein [Lewinella sp. 4G2]|uniref:DUF2075 domain-containing protein n=1 Tax=Lewinella sp. 4G2 TaxID=1803372 RepID=UPI0007B4E5E6|nr:DUF2075 domain-containing protein [Lewinella sp. 4G2]OAV45135.1 hypothetical protein A3850_011820 [Lewinella sp. 4G2]